MLKKDYCTSISLEALSIMIFWGLEGPRCRCLSLVHPLLRGVHGRWEEPGSNCCGQQFQFVLPSFFQRVDKLASSHPSIMNTRTHALSLSHTHTHI